MEPDWSESWFHYSWLCDVGQVVIYVISRSSAKWRKYLHQPYRVMVRIISANIRKASKLINAKHVEQCLAHGKRSKC